MSLLLAILILVAQIPFAFAVTASGTCGDNLTWTLDDSGTLTISGAGKMDDYTTDRNPAPAPWFPYKNSIRIAIIKNGVTSIGERAFYDCENLTNITIPNSVTSIEDWAFHLCSALTNITLPSSVTFIRYNPFSVSGLTSIHVDERNPAYSSVNGVLFNKNRTELIAYPTANSAVSYTIPNTVTHIRAEAFYGCENLENITIPNSVISIECSALFIMYGLTNVYYNGSQQQWKAIHIDEQNDVTEEDATIHYNSSGPDNEPVTPTSVETEPTTPTPIADDIRKYSYAFANESKAFGYPMGYKIPLERFQVIYGQTALAKQKCEQAFRESQYWVGSCYGIGTTAGMFVSSGNGVTAAAFRDGAMRPGELQVSDVNAEWGLTLTQFIEAMQISQYSSMTAIASLQNKNRLSALISAASAFENGGGGPVLICVYGPDRNGNYAGHALLAYHLDGQQLYVYDSNYPNDGNRAITISDDSWSYAISDGVTWNNSNGEITYIPYETYLSDWINRGHVQGTTYVSLVANVADATVQDSAGNEVAAFQKGKMVKGAEKAYPFTHIGITADGVSTAPPQVAVWLPVDDVYTVRNQDASKTRCKISLCNVNQGVSVETTSATVKLSAEDSTSMNFAAIEDIGCEYTITQMSGQDEVKFQGKTARDKVHALLENGVSSGSGITASTNISINGQTVSASDFMNGRTVSVSTISPRFTDVSPGQYFYDPVMWAVGREITNGTTATTFSPQNTCSRNHILTFLWRANGSPAAIGNPFTDVNPDTTFGKAALWAAEKGLVSGTRFNGDNPCTRAEAVTYLWKLAGRPAAGRSAFTDVPSNADYAQAVSWAVERGITKGTSDTTFEPSKICTRGQIVTFLYRTYVEN